MAGGILRTTAELLALAPSQNPASGVIASPFQFYVDDADALRVEVYNAVIGVTVALQARFLRDNGEIVPQRFALDPTADRMVTRKDYALTRGAFLNVSAFVDAGAPVVGQTFVRVRLIRGFGGATIAVGTLLQGYVTAGQDLAYPGSPVRFSTEAAFPVRVFVGTDPAAGNEISETVPTGAIWELVAVLARLTTSGAGVTRYPLLRLTSGGATFGLFQVSGGIVAGNAKYCAWCAAGTGYDALTTYAAYNGSLPPGPVLRGGDGVLTLTSNFDVADNWDAPVLCVREQLVID